METCPVIPGIERRLGREGGIQLVGGGKVGPRPRGSRRMSEEGGQTGGGAKGAKRARLVGA